MWAGTWPSSRAFQVRLLGERLVSGGFAAAGSGLDGCGLALGFTLADESKESIQGTARFIEKFGTPALNFGEPWVESGLRPIFAAAALASRRRSLPQFAACANDP